MSRSFLRHAAVYGLANIVVQAGSFVLLPLYTHCLTPADYGVLEVLGRLAETVSACLLIGGLRQALLTHYQQADGALARARVVSAALTLLAFCCVVGGGAALVLVEPLNGLLVTGGAPLGVGLLRLAVLTILLEPLTLVPLALFQARVESLAFVRVTIGQFVVRVALTVVLVAVLGWGVAGVLLATASTSVLLGAGLCLRELARHAARPGWDGLRRLFRFALPFLPGGLCFFLLHHGDRFLLLARHGKEQVGIYALGYKLALTAGTFTLMPLQMVWGARMYEAARADDAPVVFGQVFTRCLACLLFVGLGLYLFTTEAVALLGGSAYAGAGAVVLPVLLACQCQAAATLMDAAFYIRNRPGLKLGVTLATTVVMVAAYALLIPPWGSMGAALATLAGFAFLATATWAVTRRLFPVHYEVRRLAALLGLAVLVALVGAPLPATLWAAPLKVGLLVLWPIALWQLGLVSVAEMAHVRAMAAWLWRWLSPPSALRDLAKTGGISGSPSPLGGEGLGERGVFGMVRTSLCRKSSPLTPNPSHPRGEGSRSARSTLRNS